MSEHKNEKKWANEERKAIFQVNFLIFFNFFIFLWLLSDRQFQFTAVVFYASNFYRTAKVVKISPRLTAFFILFLFLRTVCVDTFDLNEL